MTSHPDDETVKLVTEAISRPPMTWSTYDGHETKCYRPLPAPSDPERPFGIVRKVDEHRFRELTGYEEVLTHRGRLVDAVGGLIRDYRISCYWQPDVTPEAQRCLLCGERNLNHPDFDYLRDPIQCQVIRNHTLDSPLNLSDNTLYRTLDAAATADLIAMLNAQGLEWG